MIYRIFPTKDTFITSYPRNGVPQTGSNFGAVEVLRVFKKKDSTEPVSSDLSVPMGFGFGDGFSLGRILSQFDVSQMTALTASGFMPSSGVTFRLRMYDTVHDQTLPYSYDLEVAAVSESWDEGRGRDVDLFSDKGYANWMMRSQQLSWSVPGATVTGSILSSHFDTGHENLDVDVSQIFLSWMSGTLPNNGFMVRVSSSLELDNNDYYVKMFYARNTNFLDKVPHIEAQWDDSVRDDRSDTVLDVTGSLYLYNRVRGELTDIPGKTQLGVRLTDVSGNLITVLTGSRVGVGVFSATFAIPSASWSGSLFNDVWFDLGNTSHAYMSATFGVSGQTAHDDNAEKRYVVTMPNLQEFYGRTEVPRMNVFVRPFDYNPASMLTGSLGVVPTVVSKGYYRIVNDRTEEVVVPFSTGSVEYSRLSYDEKGNYFKLQMGAFAPRAVYRISFLLYVDGQTLYVDDGFKFKVL